MLPPKIAQAISTKVPSLTRWAELVQANKDQSIVEDKEREELVSTLLKVYMKEGPMASKETTALLNAQALHLDCLEVLDIVPEDWNVCQMSDFFGRMIKRQHHERTHWQSR